MKAINENRMMKLIHNFFDNPQTLITELVQNAIRAKAENITINIAGGKLSVVDDGKGCDSIVPILTLAESAWDEEIENNQQPAGWGLFILYCLAQNVEITSKFGTLDLNTELFLNDDIYRKSTLSPIDSESYQNFVDTGKKADGFRISAILKNAVEQKIAAVGNNLLRFFPINIVINGRIVKRETAEEAYKDYLIKTTYMGNKVFIGTTSGFPMRAHDFDVVWYGLPIFAQINPLSYVSHNAVINVTQGLPLTPVLPFRTNIKQDEKATQFWSFMRQTIVDYCIDQINNSRTKNPLQLLLTMEDLATQDELNRLDRFCVTTTQPYYNPDDSEWKIVSKGEQVVSEDIEITVVDKGKKKTLKPRGLHPETKRFVGDYDGIFLQDGAIVKRQTRSKRPEWLKIQTHILNIEVNIDNTDKYHGNMDWNKSEIMSAGSTSSSDTGTKDLDVIGIDYGCGLSETTIYYADDPGDVWDLQHPIVNYFFNDEGDTFDTQEDCISEAIEDDLRNIRGKFSLGSLLDGFQKVSGINIDNIKNISINEKEMTVALKKGGKKVLSLT